MREEEKTWHEMAGEEMRRHVIGRENEISGEQSKKGMSWDGMAVMKRWEEMRREQKQNKVEGGAQ